MGNPVHIGGPDPRGSWIQSLGDTGYPFSYDLIAMRITSAGDSFVVGDEGGVQDISNDWELVYNLPQIVAISGPPVFGWLSQFDLHFEGDAPEPLTLEYVVFADDGEFPSRGFTGTFSGTKWLFASGCGWDPPRTMFLPVPAPGAALLGFLGLGLAGWVRRRFS